MRGSTQLALLAIVGALLGCGIDRSAPTPAQPGPDGGGMVGGDGGAALDGAGGMDVGAGEDGSTGPRDAAGDGTVRLDGEVLPGDASVGEDAGRGMDAGDCSPEPETCDGVDQDCDGVIDSASVCPCTFVTRGGHSYLLCTDTVSWDSARSFCMMHGYDLATIETTEENAYLSSQAEPLGGDNWYIGLRRSGSNWAWVSTGTVQTLDLWESGEPGSGDQCANLDTQTNGGWESRSCSDTERFICEAGG